MRNYRNISQASALLVLTASPALPAQTPTVSATGNLQKEGGRCRVNVLWSIENPHAKAGKLSLRYRVTLRTRTGNDNRGLLHRIAPKRRAGL